MLLKIGIELFFLLWGQNVVDLVLRFHVFNVNSACGLETGELAFGGTNGLTFVDPARIRYNSYAPPVSYTHLTRQFLSFLIVMAIWSFGLSFIYEQSSEEFLEMACVPASILIAHFFTVLRRGLRK